MISQSGTIIKKSPNLFFFYFESIYYMNLPCQILSHDFDERSDFLNYKFSIRLPATAQSKNGWVQKRELGRGRVQSRHQYKRGYSSMQKRNILSFVVCFSLRLTWKRLFSGVAALSWLDDVARTPLIQIIVGLLFGALSNSGSVWQFTWDNNSVSWSKFTNLSFFWSYTS